MGAGKANPPIEPREPPASERLESWKEIANYLKRGVRTIQRWEKQEGLPIHRHLHDKLGTVYAYKPEIDAWWENGRSRLEQQEQVRASSRRPLGWAVAAAVVVVAAAGVGLWLWLGQQPALPFEERDWVLIASFENRTGEAVFDGTLEYALERELSNSRFVNVVPRERINDTLQLMKRPLDTSVDAVVGREMALRDGGIRTLITGRVEKLDTTYLLSASLMNPSSGVTVVSFSEDAQGQKEVVPAIRRLANRVRESLGEELATIQQSEQKLEKVTTPSLRALHLYSQGMALVNEYNWQHAAALLEQAVEEDPEFASAHIVLAHCLSNVRKEDEAALHYQRAFELADTTTEGERYFILGSYYARFLKDTQKAAQAYEILVRLYPDHYWGGSNLARLYMRQGRLQDAVPYIVRRAESLPNNFDDNVDAWLALAMWANDPSQAQPYLQRARELASRENEKVYPDAAVLLKLLPAYEHWLRGEAGQALAEVTQVAQTLDSRSGREKVIFRSYVVAAYMALGQLKPAEELFQSYPEPRRSRALAQLAWARGDQQAFQEHMSKTDTSRSSYISAIFLVRAGLLSEAQVMILSAGGAMESSPSLLSQALGKAARGVLALARGHSEEAIPLLEDAVEIFQPWAGFEFLLASESLARAWEQKGELQSALEVLDEAADARTRLYSIRTGMGPAVQWTENEFRRGQLYRKLGREEEAQEVEAHLLKLLAVADPDHAILRQLKQSQDVAAVQPAM